MSTLLRAADEPAASRLDYWRSVLEGTLVPKDFSDMGGLVDRARLLIGQVGAMEVVEATGAWAPATSPLSTFPARVVGRTRPPGSSSRCSRARCSPCRRTSSTP